MTALESMLKADEERAKSVALLDLILRAFKVFNGFTGPSHEGLWWRTDGEYAPLTLFINDNDLFMWGCADAEELNVATFTSWKKPIETAPRSTGWPMRNAQRTL